MRFDCVLGYHMNPNTCGIAKFNAMLAARFGVPFVSLFDPAARGFERPLLSIRAAEFSGEDNARFASWVEDYPAGRELTLFLHGYADAPAERVMASRAAAIYVVNPEIHARMAAAGFESQALWCPGTNMKPVDFKETELSVFSFGMAHKVRAEQYRRLRKLLDATGKPYSIYLSTALHEGTRFDDSFSGAFDELRGIFGERVHFLGYLSDQAVFNYLRRTTYFAAFFEGGVRANNTSVNAALQSSAVVITNCDLLSPPQLVHGRNILDIALCDRLPTDPGELAEIGREAERVGNGPLGWEALMRALGLPDTAAAEELAAAGRMESR